MVLDNFTCNGTETTLLNCHNHSISANGSCSHNHDISVRCVLKEEQRIKNINISITINSDINALSAVHTALISWVLYNSTMDMDEPISFDVI